MKRLLMLCFDFPPITGVAGERALRFLRHLPTHGWAADIVTVRQSPLIAHDEKSLDQIPPGVRVFRTPFVKTHLPVSALSRLLPQAWRIGFKSYFALPDFHVGWLPFLIPTLRRLLGSGAPSYDALYSTSPPPSAHLAACWAKRRHRIPWMADFRDPWTENPVWRAPTPAHRRLASRWEEMVLREADAVIANTEESRLRLLQRYPSLSGKLHHIPNGFAEEDFAGLKPPHARAKRLVISHAGTIYPHYDFSLFFSALSGLLESSPALRSEIRIKLFGNQPASAALARLGLSDVVEEHPWLPRHALLSRLSDSDALLLCLSGWNPADPRVPAKTYTYLKLRKPVLALVPEGETRRILERGRVARFCDPHDVDNIKEGLLRIFADWKAGTLHITPDCDYISSFAASRLTERFSKVLGTISG